MVEPDRPQMKIRRMLFALWITGATHTYTSNTSSSPQLSLSERACFARIANWGRVAVVTRRQGLKLTIACHK